MPAKLKLHTFALSHFSEKTRWMLDAAGVDYIEEPWVPFLHVFKALRKGGRGATTVPVLDTGAGCVQDSTRILFWLEKHRAPLALLPTDAALRAEVLAIEDRFDRVGRYVIRYAYSVVLDNPQGVVALWTIGATPMQARIVRLGFPLMLKLLRRKFKLDNPAAVATAEQQFGEALDWLAAQVKDGRQFLVGQQLSAADITAAALLAPIVCPDEHPVYSRADYRKGVVALHNRWSAHPGAAWVRGIYRAHRQSAQNL